MTSLSLEILHLISWKASSFTSELVTTLIDRAGGMRPEAYPMSSMLIRNGQEIQVSFSEIINNARSKFNFPVMDGDSILIGSKPNLVIIKGEVNNPGNYQYTKGYRLSDYIKLSGGLTENAARGSIYITYPDGKSKKLKYFGISPMVHDGSIITALREEEVEKFSFTEYVTSMTAFWADLSQAYLMIILALRNS